LSASKPLKVAVVAVHGVAYHEPGSSANSVSELLLGLPQDGRAKYGPFAAETVHIPLNPLSVIHPVHAPQGGFLKRFLDRFRERTVYLTRAWRSAKGARQLTGEKPDEMAANDFMRLVLQEYRGSKGTGNKPKDERDATAYRTARLAGKRTWKDDSGTEQAIGVDVYEMYWADLSRPKQTLLSFFQALYQLLFHLASLGRLAISSSYENRDDWRWRALDWTQGWAVRMLTLPIPILNVLLLISLLGALPHLITSDSTARIAAVCGAAFLGLLIYAVLSRKLPATKWPWTWVLFPLAFMFPLAVIAVLVVGFLHVSSHAVLAFEGLLLGSDVYRRLSAGSYDDVRDGTWETALGLWVPWMILFAVLLFGYPAISIEQVTLWVVQIVLGALRLSWILLFDFAFAAFVLGGLSWRKIRRDEKKKENGDQNRCARARAAVRTGRLALALPTIGILIVTLALFSILFIKTTTNKTGSPPIAERLFGETIKAPLSPPFWLVWLVLDRNATDGAAHYIDGPLRPDSLSPNEYFKGVLVWSATPAFPIVLALLLCGLLLMVLWSIPSIYSEKHPPQRSDNKSSKRLGSWVSRGLDASKISTMLTWSAAFAVPAFLVTWIELQRIGELQSIFNQISDQMKKLTFYWPAIFSYLIHWTAIILLWMGAVAGSLAILASLAKSGSSVLGIILDVDNYLRTSPKEETPRARIMERYVSLLHYLSEYKTPEDGKPYDRIVIVAHSLGALISADLLRFLKVQSDSPKIPLTLFTMGNPLRQLLNRFFPYLYEWVHPLPDNSLSPLEDVPQTAPTIDSGELPNPNLLGVAHWVNAYRSGDYVGRSLWLNEWYDREVPAKPGDVYIATETPLGPREEMCIGAGAHQHYWDQSAPDIAEKLDDLIK
jgi:hypothetical protein